MSLLSKGKFQAVLFFIAIIIVVYTSVIYSETKYQTTSTASLYLSETIREELEVVHMETPEPLKAVYMSQCAASTDEFRSHLLSLIKETELNSIIIDIKDYTGSVSFVTGNTVIDEIGGKGCKVPDMKEYVRFLHENEIYVIGRLTVFQDPAFTNKYPEYAVKSKKTGGVWRDRKGLAFVDVGARPFWEYVFNIAKAAHEIGFDEINFDYIRFPSDGDMKDTFFSHTGTTTKKAMLKEFFAELDKEMGAAEIKTSADIFGMTTTNRDDLNIGQILEYALMHFDYVAPMVYPSHYPNGFNGWDDPNKVPYDIVKFSMSSALRRSDFLYLEIASSSPSSPMLKRIKPEQLRTWIQDFDYPVTYTSSMVEDQLKAVYDSGLTSWMLWDPSNYYTRESLQSN